MSLLKMINFMSSGLVITFQLVPICLISTLVVGVILGILMFKKIPIMDTFLSIYKIVMRGIPAIVILKLLYYSANLDSAFFTSFLSLSLYHAAYVGDIVRGCLEAVPKGQMMAGESLGVGFWTIMRKIYIPQILKPMVPMLCGQYVLLVKDTTIVYVVGVMDLMWMGRQLMALTFNPILGYLLIGVFYYLLCSIIEFIGHRVEKRTDHSSSTYRLSNYY